MHKPPKPLRVPGQCRCPSAQWSLPCKWVDQSPTDGRLPLHSRLWDMKEQFEIPLKPRWSGLGVGAWAFKLTAPPWPVGWNNGTVISWKYERRTDYRADLAAVRSMRWTSVQTAIFRNVPAAHPHLGRAAPAVSYAADRGRHAERARGTAFTPLRRYLNRRLGFDCRCGDPIPLQSGARHDKWQLAVSLRGFAPEG